MKTKFFIPIIFLLIACECNSQFAFNDKLFLQLNLNLTTRLASNSNIKSSLQEQNKLYDSINNKMIQVVAIHNYIYDKLHNVNSAILQGKRLMYVYSQIQEITTNTGELMSWTARRPQYAVLITNLYESIYIESTQLVSELHEQALREETNYLMDPMDRSVLIQKISDQFTLINAYIEYIIFKLRLAKDTPYLSQVPGLRDYISLDRAIVQDIIQNIQIYF